MKAFTPMHGSKLPYVQVSEIIHIWWRAHINCCLSSSVPASCLGLCSPTQSLTLNKKIKPSKTSHIWTAHPQLTCNVKSTFPWHWSNVSWAFSQPLFNPQQVLWGPAAWPLITHSAVKRQTRHPNRFGSVARPNQLWLYLACLAHCSGK